MLQSLGLTLEGASVEAAVKQAVVDGQGTKEIGGTLGTKQTGDYVADAIKG
jgi:isocitrate/isopropylmalate dehydrogenase